MNYPRMLPKAFRAFSSSRIPAKFPDRPRRAFSSRPPVGSIPWPVITEVSSEGWKTYDIFSKLLQERIVCLYGAIDDFLAASVVAQLLHLEAADSEKPITMYVNSPGGSISSGLAIYDTMQYISAPVSTVVIGQASSMGALLLTGGAAGKRYALPHASVMVHQPLGGTQGQATDVIIYATQMARLREQVNHIYLRHLNSAFGSDKYSLRDVSEAMERDKYMTAEEALEFGIVDEILTRRTDATGTPPAPGGRAARTRGADNGGGGGGTKKEGVGDGRGEEQRGGRKDGEAPGT